MDTKVWWQSKAIWGSIVSFAAIALGAILHKNVSAADQQAIVDVIMSLISGAGTVVAIYGRVVATTQIGTPEVKP